MLDVYISATSSTKSTLILFFNQQSKRNLGLMGEIRVKELTSAEPSVPVGHCKDPKHGDKVPKDGTFCNDFLWCFYMVISLFFMIFFICYQINKIKNNHIVTFYFVT